MKIGDKIRKIRELKSITPKDMADRLHITTQSYHKIERDEVTINMDRLLELSKIFDMKPEDVMIFDEKYVFQIMSSPYSNGYQANTGETHYHNFPVEMKNLYEDKIKLQDEKNQLLIDKINYLQEKIKDLEEKPAFNLFKDHQNKDHKKDHQGKDHL
jgi:transcriptional regulator with XRE-family HTH domain